MRPTRRTLLKSAASLGAATVLGWQSAPAIARELAGQVRADDGAHVVAETFLGPRVLDLFVESPALQATVGVRLLLPRRWRPNAERTWPVLYLLHGGRDDYTSWTRETDVVELVEDFDVLVVTPTGGRDGFYSDWWNLGAGGPPRWETFHLVELRQILERGYGGGRRRAIAGLSMGGFGTMSYAARHPGLFQAVASFSGVVHTTYQNPRGPSLIQAVVAGEGHDPFALWGDPTVNADIWAAHNPFDLAHRLLDIPLYVSSGNGQPGPLDPPGSTPDPVIEQLCGEESAAFVARLRNLGATVTADLYGPGLHSWPYWERALHDAFPMLMDAIGAR